LQDDGGGAKHGAKVNSSHTTPKGDTYVYEFNNFQELL
jgi:hypothetical protein